MYDRLREEILSCALSPGKAFRESEIAERFGVSKSPIRDALQRLELEGLVEIEPRRGHRVAPISISDAKDILELRELLEAGAVRMIVANATDTELASLDRLRYTDTSDLKAFAIYNRDFHQTICDAAKNRRLSASVAQLMENYDRLCIVSLSSSEAPSATNMGQALAEHNELIDALQARNAAAAVRTSARHIKTSRRHVLEGLKAMQVVT